MIQRFFITCPDADGKGASETDIILNGRLCIKHRGSAEEIFRNYFRHLSALPHEYVIEHRISASAEGISTFVFLLEELPFSEGVFSPLPKLTVRQVQILDLLNKGKTGKEISEIFCISYGAVRNHCSKMHPKFHCGTTGEMLVAARALGIVN